MAETFAIQLPTASVYQKVMATTAHSDEALSEGKIRALKKHMSHFETTSTKYCQLPGAKNMVEMHHTIKQLTKGIFTVKQDAI